MDYLTNRFTRYILIIIIFVTSIGAFNQYEQLDINKAPLRDLEKLPISKIAKEKLYEYLLHYGALKSIYDLRKIKEITPEEFETLKLMIKITPPESITGDYLNVYRIQKALATEEGVTKAAVEEWQDMLVNPINVNKARFEELAILQNVSLIDAAAVIKHRKLGRELKNYRDLRDVSGLSNYGFRNMRAFVSYSDPPALKFQGNYRINFEYGKSYDPTFEPSNLVSLIRQAYNELNNREAFYRQGFSDYEIENYFCRLQETETHLKSLISHLQYSHRFRFRIGDNFILGARIRNNFPSSKFDSETQGYLQVSKKGLINKLFFGDFRVVWGQGLLLDNAPEFVARTYTRTQGIYGDLSANSRLGFRGVGAEFIHQQLNVTGFYSQKKRDGIVNPDGTIYYYIISEPRLPVNADKFFETNYGGRIQYDLSSWDFFPVGSAIGFNFLTCQYDKNFNPRIKWVDLPTDNTFFDDPNILNLSTGKKRMYFGFDFRTVIENVSLEGEYAQASNESRAYLLQSRVQYDYLYLLGIIRHYDIGYDNPYNRGFAEQKRFEDTPFEKPYRLVDPSFTALQSFPMPKAEEGVYLETRYQISRQITFTRIYFDVWRNLGYSFTNYRFQGEVEYRPVFPLRFRVKHKYQYKNLPKKTQATVSKTHETSFRILVSLTERNFLSCELRRGLVDLVPSMAYNNEKVIWGDFLATTWEHNFSEALALESGLAVWKCNGLSQWIFEDIGIDFLDGKGMRYYFVITQRPTKFLMFRLKLRGKYTKIPYTGILNASGLHYSNGQTVILRDFVIKKELFNIALQLDFLW
ncbi:MAG: helix-hairpin-helix domain-containing protein [candidate division WOR-3 bacterium]|nr:helix-hairpin-helix domain-containing protein [candidate division WOR-3 bacterium]MCX7757247.1 helix-hairpin-helix domain-containing protein [candidate division WOR-3 bacterium]MDW7987591.1 hypothetical protein [candidate division WOR-3 bacterium]